MIFSSGQVIDLEIFRKFRMFCLENQYSDDLLNKVQVVNIGFQEMFVEGMLMNELDYQKRQLNIFVQIRNLV